MAEGIFKKLIKEDDALKHVSVFSAGTNVCFETNAQDKAINALKDLEVDISGHKSKPISVDLINHADLILTMTNSHKLTVVNMVPIATDKIFTLKEYVGSDTEDPDILDPYGADLEYYKKCSKDIYENLVRLIDKIKKR